MATSALPAGSAVSALITPVISALEAFAGLSVNFSMRRMTADFWIGSGIPGMTFPPEATAAGHRRLRFLPGHFVQMMPRGQPAQHEPAAVDEAQIRPGGERADHVGYEDLAGSGLRADARRRVHGGAEQLPAFGNGFPRVDPDAYLDGAV